MSRHELTGAQRTVLASPIRTCKGGPGLPGADDRPTLNGILYAIKTGCAWKDMPHRYGPPTTHWHGVVAWSPDATWERLWRVLLSELKAGSELDRSHAFLDGGFAPAKKGEIPSGER